MVAGEPNDVRVRAVDGEWVVQVVENGELTTHPFKTQRHAENFAEGQRWRLGMPGKPPLNDVAD
jgi:hypothetical protein